MIKSSRKFKEYFKKIYDSNHLENFCDKSFQEVFSSNQTRMEYIYELFKEYERNRLTFKGKDVFEETIDYIVDFINGKEKSSSLTVPSEYYNDQSLGAIIPTDEELYALLKLIKANKIMFEVMYRDNPFTLKLPNQSFNQNMTRILEIKEYNIAHLLGLSEHEDINNPDPSKNLLKKHFNSVVKDKSKYAGNTEAEKLLNWILSMQGQHELFRIHKLTKEFVKKDKLQNPGSYIGDNLKPDSKVIAKFKERYKKSVGLDYPIINFSRLMSKSINTLNFLKLSNVSEVVLDYNAPQGKSNEKDIFLVNRNSKKISDNNSRYVKLRDDLLVDFIKCGSNDDEAAKNRLIDKGININSKKIKDQLNIIKAHDFIGAYDIEPDDSIVDEKIIESINDDFKRDVHLIGFGTDFKKDKEIPLYYTGIHKAHCDTSIALTTPELIGHYYKYGRTFFLDKIETETDVLRVSNVNDEIYYLKRVKDIKKDASEKLANLISLKSDLNQAYKYYLDSNQKIR